MAHYQGGDPDGFASCEVVTRFIEDYARLIDAPVHCGVNVLSLEQDASPSRFVVRTSNGPIKAKNVVIATGPFQRPAIPAPAAHLPPEVVQIHANDYRNPNQLPPGAVLIVGCGSSGCQIAEELYDHGREVYLSVRSHRIAPRRYHGRDLFSWLVALGKFDATIGSQPNHRIPAPLLLTGAKGGHDINLRQFGERGMHLLGSFLGIEDGTLHFGADLEGNLAKADAALAEFKELADAHLRALGESAQDADNAKELSEIAHHYEPVAQHLNCTQIGAVVSCTGYRGDFGWVHLSIFDARSNPVQRRGVTGCSGAYFLPQLGLRKLRADQRKSPHFVRLGVHTDQPKRSGGALWTV